MDTTESGLIDKDLRAGLSLADTPKVIVSLQIVATGPEIDPV